MFPHLLSLIFFCFPSIMFPLTDTGRTICSAKKNSFFAAVSCLIY